MGLLDQFGSMSDDQTQGLLAAAAQMMQQSGPSLRPMGLGQILGGGMTAYQDSTLAARKRKLDEDQAAQMAQLRGLQIQDATGTLQDHTLARTENERYRNYLSGGGPQPGSPAPAPTASAIPARLDAPMASAMPGGPMSPNIGGPDWMQAYQAQQQPMASTQAPAQAPPQAAPSPQSAAPAFGSYDYMMAKAQDLMRNGFPTQAQAMMKEAISSRPKYSTDFRTATGADGQPHNFVLADDGTWKDTGLGVKPEMTEVDLGGSKQFVDKNRVTNGQTFDKTMTFADRQGAARLKFDKDQALQKDVPSDTPFMRELGAMYPKGSPEYDEALRQRINKETGVNSAGGGGRSVVYNGRIIASGNEVAQALKNITDLPVQSNSGFMGMGGGHSSNLFSAGMSGLKNELNPDQVKTYNTMWTGISRNLGTLETSGLATTGDLIKSIDKLQFAPGDNGYNALRKLAEVRQITEAALDPKLHDPAVPPQQKQYIQNVIDAVRTSVPYTHADLTRYDRAAQKNPALTLQEFAAQTVNKGNPSPAAAATAPPAVRKTATLSDIAATAKASGRSTADVTAAMRAQGYTIGGE